MENLVWRKWHRIDANLLVALETTLPAGKAPEYVLTPPVDLPEEMIHRAKELSGPIARVLKAAGASVSRESVDRYYHPRIGGPADLIVENRSVSFKVHVRSGLFKRLIFWRKGEDGPAPSMRCGRLAEEEFFGFNTPGSKSVFYLPLAFPGKNGRFEPIFVRVADYENGVYFLEISASGVASEVVVVGVEVVNSSLVPAFLRDHN